MSTFERSVSVPAPRAELFAWHQRPGAFERLAPSWERIEIVSRTGDIRDGDRLHFRVRKGPIGLPWVARHEGFVAGHQFVDVAERSPFASWRHVHTCEDEGEGSRLRDAVTYRLPLHGLTHPLVGARVEAMLEQMFHQRHARTVHDLRRHQAAAARGCGPMRVAITGASGLIGTELQAFLTTGGHAVAPVVRRPPKPGANEVQWDPATQLLDPAGLEGLDAVVHLAGEPVLGRWTAAKRHRIRSSRVEGTQLLCEALARLEHKPRVLICASAIGIYGDAGDCVLDEEAGVGSGFLAKVTRDWEAATRPAIDAGIRVVALRIGIVNSGHGAALAQLRLPYSLGLGGPVGDGGQWHSWIDLDDLVGVIHHAIVCDELRGPVNAVAPAPVRQRDYARILGRVLRRPSRLRLPATLVRAMFGELADEVLLASARVGCRRLLDSGFEFDLPTLEDSLRHQLGRARV
ncbi:TIGR01777 family oxidoreductase [Enhygromyxa salina]|uniref:TIGR01777 family oxidoreductase n=1 Tax=Enhygromyxa salina TaxID=215803 RepID=UPI001FD3186A|nr:TIGR01777 family oxidoreductase [Enhygromyxa salina]